MPITLLATNTTIGIIKCYFLFIRILNNNVNVIEKFLRKKKMKEKKAKVKKLKQTSRFKVDQKKHQKKKHHVTVQNKTQKPPQITFFL